MGQGLQRARTAAKRSRVTPCPVCGQTVLIRANATIPRIPYHGPRGNPCRGSGQEVKP